MKRGALFAPSLLAADFSNVRYELDRIHKAGSDWIHLDVMDGVFVPNLTFGAKMVGDLRPHTELPLDVHLMVINPENYIEPFLAAGANYLTFHLEASVHADRMIQSIRAAGMKPGISIVPSTPVSSLVELLPKVDLVLIMSVNPGFGGQALIESCLPKLTELHRYRDTAGGSYLISIDGGVNEANAAMVRGAGAEVIVSGSAFFNSQDPATTVEKIVGR